MKNLMKKIRKNNKGFTLVELIIVIAIIAVLSAVAAPQYIKYVERSRQGVDASTLEEIRHAVEVEAAINPPTAATTVTVSNAGAIDTPASGGYANLDQVELITGDPVTLKSKAATKTGVSFTIDISADGKVTWNGAGSPPTAGSSAELIAQLQAGTAPTT